ncbi:MAG: MFS transporter, partial [Pseudonocardia sp.]|nr:MFS transporter [Pseudonocardia sp.]
MAQVKRGVRASVGAVSTTTASVLPIFLTGGLAVQISAELGFDPAGLGLVVALFFGVSAFASLPCGWVVERYGSGPTSRIAVLGAAVVMACVALFARSYGALVTILLCSAWCNVLGQLSSNLTLARYVPANRLGLSFGIKQAAIPLATLLAGASVPAVALTWGWRWAYGIGAGLALAALLVAPRDTAGHSPIPATPGERATGALSVIGVAAGLAAASSSALGIFLVASAVDRGIDAGAAGLTLTLGSVVGLVLRLLHGWAADRRSGGHIAVVAASLV